MGRLEKRRRAWQRFCRRSGCVGSSRHRGLSGPGFRGRFRPWQVTIGVGLLLAALLIGFLEARLRPMVVTAAQAQAQNAIAQVVEQAVLEQLGEQGVTYSDLVTIQRDASGAIAALTTNTAAMNRLRAELIGVVLEALDGIDVSQIQIPLGSLLDFDLIWGLGPTMKVHAMTVGTVDGTFDSTFSSVGVNQTLHKIDLELAVPLTLMLPGGAVETTCVSRLPIAETVIVGQVPETYLQF